MPLTHEKKSTKLQKDAQSSKYDYLEYITTEKTTNVYDVLSALDTRYCSSSMIKQPHRSLSMLNQQYHPSLMPKQPEAPETKSMAVSLPSEMLLFIQHPDKLHHTFDTKNIKIYRLKKKKFPLSSLLMVFASDVESNDSYDKHSDIINQGSYSRAPFVALDYQCKNAISYYYERINFVHTKNKNTIQVKFLFYVGKTPDILLSFGIMILHHAGIIDLFNNSTIFKKFLECIVGSFKNSRNFKKFLDFASTRVDDEEKGVNDEEKALAFARSNDIENQGLFCIKNMEGVNKNFCKMFSDFIIALNKLSHSGLYHLNKDHRSTQKYQDAFTKLEKDCRQYSCSSETSSTSLFLKYLSRAIWNINKCIESFIQDNSKHESYISSESHFCTCLDEKRVNYIVDVKQELPVTNIGSNTHIGINETANTDITEPKVLKLNETITNCSVRIE